MECSTSFLAASYIFSVDSICLGRRSEPVKDREVCLFLEENCQKIKSYRVEDNIFSRRNCSAFFKLKNIYFFHILISVADGPGLHVRRNNFSNHNKARYVCEKF